MKASYEELEQYCEQQRRILNDTFAVLRDHGIIDERITIAQADLPTIVRIVAIVAMAALNAAGKELEISDANSANRVV